MNSNSESGANSNNSKSRFGSSYTSRVLLTVTAVSLLINYVETMVIPGIPAIQADLSTTATLASWITSAFLIVGAAVAPLFGKLGDIYGKKKSSSQFCFSTLLELVWLDLLQTFTCL